MRGISTGEIIAIWIGLIIMIGAVSSHNVPQEDTATRSPITEARR